MNVRLLLLLVIAMLVFPSAISSSTESHSSDRKEYFTLSKSKVDNLEVLASVPKGLPIHKEHIKIPVPICSGFGMRFHPVLRRNKMHNGIDFPAKIGTPIVSTSYGVVIKVENHPGYGNMVSVQSGDYVARFAHCLKVLVSEGDRVKSGDTIALVGSSGISTGPHCHYEVLVNGKHVNPYNYL